jgi:hypothetical protein
MARPIYMIKVLAELLYFLFGVSSTGFCGQMEISSIADCISLHQDDRYASIHGWWVSDKPIFLEEQNEYEKPMSDKVVNIQVWQFGHLALFLSDYSHLDSSVGSQFNGLPTRNISAFCIVGDELMEIRTDFNIPTYKRELLHGHLQNGMQIVLSRDSGKGKKNREERPELITLTRVTLRRSSKAEEDKFAREVTKLTKGCKTKYAKYSIRECVLVNPQRSTFAFLGEWYYPYRYSAKLDPKQTVYYMYTEVYQSGNLVVQLDEWPEDSGFEPKMLTLWCETNGKLTSIVDEVASDISIPLCVNSITKTSTGWIIGIIEKVFCPGFQELLSDRLCYESGFEYRRRLIDDDGICSENDFIKLITE